MSLFRCSPEPAKGTEEEEQKHLGQVEVYFQTCVIETPQFFSCYDRAAPHRDFVFFPFQSLNSCLFSVHQAKDVPLWALGCGAGIRLRPQFGVGVLGQPRLQQSQQQGEDAGECPVHHLQCCCLLLFYSMIGCNRHENVQPYVRNKLS